jgi:cytosine/adenosine deaminase-related metal-dependent hydrolase
MSKELLIKGGHVVTVDPDLGDLPVGDVLVTDGVITAVGQELTPASAAAEVIDAAGRLVIPAWWTPIGTSGRAPSAATPRRSPGPGTGPPC